MLSERQTRFVRAYLSGADAAEAAVQAGYSAARARRQGRALLQKPEIAAELAKAEAEALETAAAKAGDGARRVSRDRIEAELARIAFAGGEVRDGDRLRALEMLTKLLAPEPPEDADAPVCGVVILPAAGEGKALP